MEESGGFSIKEPFFTRDDVPPVLETNKYWLLNVLRDDLTWLCPVEREGIYIFKRRYTRMKHAKHTFL